MSSHCSRCTGQGVEAGRAAEGHWTHARPQQAAVGLGCRASAEVQEIGSLFCPGHVCLSSVPALLWCALAELLIRGPLLQGCRVACLLVSLFWIGSLDRRTYHCGVLLEANDWGLKATLRVRRSRMAELQPSWQHCRQSLWPCMHAASCAAKNKTWLLSERQRSKRLIKYLHLAPVLADCYLSKPDIQGLLTVDPPDHLV